MRGWKTRLIDIIMYVIAGFVVGELLAAILAVFMCFF